MDSSSGRDSRFNMDYNMGLLSGDTPSEIYGNPNVTLGRPSSGLTQQMSRTGMLQANCGSLTRGLKRPSSDSCFDDRGMGSGLGLDACGGVQDVADDSYTSLQQKKSPPSNGKKTKGRVKIKMEYIDNKLRRYTTFSKRKTGIMKKAYELSTLTGTQVMLLVASETGHVYTFATRKLQPMITSEAGKALIQTCLNSPDPPTGGPGGPSGHGGDQRMSATGFEETELTYNIADDETKVRQLVYGNTGAATLSQSHLQHYHGGHLEGMSVGMSPPAGMMTADHSPGGGGGYQQQQQACPSPLPPAQAAYVQHQQQQHQQQQHPQHHSHNHHHHHHHGHPQPSHSTHSHMHHHPQQR